MNELSTKDFKIFQVCKLKCLKKNMSIMKEYMYIQRNTYIHYIYVVCAYIDRSIYSIYSMRVCDTHHIHTHENMPNGTFRNEKNSRGTTEKKKKTEKYKQSLTEL